ncbi:MAG: DUF2726 domain-containing protein [Candidatus Liptonbacteria bacterium]
MTQFIIIVLIVLGIGGFLAIHNREGKDRILYGYKKRSFFLSRAEHECYDALVTAVGNQYYVFAQVHLPTLVDNKVVGQNWHAAFRHISEKSVDFVLCDKAYISPKLAIELDDKTHERPERMERDREVERILKDAGISLLRLENHGRFSPLALAEQIRDMMGSEKRLNRNL